MNVGARTGCWASGGGGWVNPYVTDGLVAMWDGEWNVGGGVHDEIATAWKDLVGENDLTVDRSKSEWLDKGFRSLGLAPGSAYKIDANVFPVTLEVSFRFDSAEFDVSKQGSLVSICNFADYRNPWYGKFFSWIGSKKALGVCAFVAYQNPADGCHTMCAISETLYSFYTRVPTYVDGANVNFNPNSGYANDGPGVCINGNMQSNIYPNVQFQNGVPFQFDIYCIRAYSRTLNINEVAANYAVDSARFNLPTPT